MSRTDRPTDEFEDEGCGQSLFIAAGAGFLVEQEVRHGR